MRFEKNMAHNRETKFHFFAPGLLKKTHYKKYVLFA